MVRTYVKLSKIDPELIGDMRGEIIEALSLDMSAVSSLPWEIGDMRRLRWWNRLGKWLVRVITSHGVPRR